MPRVLVAVAAHHTVAKFVPETLESLRNQTYKDFELIIQDEDELPNFKWNRALDHYTFVDYIAFPHGDDVYEPTWLEEMVRELDSKPEAVAAFCTDTFIDEDSRRMAGHTYLPFKEQKPLYYYKDIINAMLAEGSGNFLRCPSVVLRRSLVGDLRYDGHKNFGGAGDTAFWYTLLHHAGPITILDKHLVRYRQHVKQASHKQRNAVFGGGSVDHWDAMEYAISLRPDDIESQCWIRVHAMLELNRQAKEMERIGKKKETAKSCRLIVAHEAPDAAGTGVVAAHRVREYNKGEEESISYYVYPNTEGTFQTDGFGAGVPVCQCPPQLFQSLVRKLKPELIEYHHTLVWGDDILRVDTTARKELYLHDRHMWADHPHADSGQRETRHLLEGVKVFGNSEWTCREASAKLGVEVTLFNPFVPLPNGPITYRKRVGYFGGFNPVKGIDLLLKAARKLPDVQFVLFTNAPEMWQQGRSIYGHPNTVVVGSYTRPDMRNLGGLVDLCVVPSRFESYGLVKRELESLGIPVIATKTGGMDGTLPPDNLQALVEAIG